MLRAIDVANFVVHYCFNHDVPNVSNLRLQKLLYYIQGYYFSSCEKELFDGNFYAWEHGPVHLDVYRAFSMYGGLDIILFGTAPFLYEKVELFVQEAIEKKKNYTTWELVEETHRELPWREAVKYFGKNAIIPNSRIKDFFMSAATHGKHSMVFQ